jgi:hypothetical protein
LRNTHAAFDGVFQLMESDAETLCVRWERDVEFAALRVDMRTADFELTFSSPGGVRRVTFTSSPPRADYSQPLG